MARGARPSGLSERIAGLRSRGEVKGLAAEVDRDPDLSAELRALAVARDLDPAEDSRRLLRALRDRAEAAQIRRNPIRRDEPFTCLCCGAEVARGGARVRDHCPVCLRGLHVDRVPGDRAADCGGLLDPVGFSLAGGEVTISWRCRRCGAPWRGRAHPDDELPPGLPGQIDEPERWRPQDAPPPVKSADGARSPAEDRARTLPLRVLEAIRSGGLWAPGQRVLVAVSGGRDSVALLHLLVATQGGHGGLLSVCCLDHGLRPESAEEQTFVAGQAHALGLPFHGSRLAIPAGPNLAARAREARRAALRAIGADRVATAHHQDDQAETVLTRLLRGSGGLGLAAMAPLDAPWCRPLLNEPAAVIHAWTDAQGLVWREDPSNADSQRGRLRALWPALDAIQGGASEALARSARLLARDGQLLDQLAHEAWARVQAGDGLDLARLHAEPPAIQLRLLRRLVAPAPVQVRADQLERALGWAPQGGAALTLSGGWKIRYQAGRLRLEGPAG